MGQVAPLAHDAPPLEILAALFDARGWRIDLADGEDFAGNLAGSWGSYAVRAMWRGADRTLQLLCLPGIAVSAADRARAHELLALVNPRLWLGHFELWGDGVLLFRHASLLPAHGALSLDQAQALVEAAVEECDRFYPAFQFVLWGGREPADALAAALIDPVGEA